MSMRHSIVIAALLLSWAPGAGQAAQVRLLMLGKTRQQVDFSYRFDGNQSDDRSSNRHHLLEGYRFDVDYGVLTPRLLNGHVAAGVRFDQSSVSGTGASGSTDTGFSLMYDITGNLLDKSATPMNFMLQSVLDEVPSSFGPGYQLLSDTYGAGFSINNRYVPVYARFLRVSNETRGLPDDRFQTHDAFLFGAKHAYKEFSTTEFNLSSYDDHSESVTGAQQSDATNFDAALTNDLKFRGERKEHTLRSTFRAVEQAGDTEYRTWSWSESLQSIHGKALRTGLGFTHDDRDIQGRQSQTNTGRASLQHRLFESLMTQIEVNGRRNTSNIGSDQDVTGRLGVSYWKKLFPGARLQIAANESYGVTDRNLLSTVATIFNEPHQIDAFLLNFFVPLDNQDPVEESVVVRNQDLLRRPTPYVLGTDYLFDTVAGRRGIRLIGTDFRDGDVLLITYDVLVNPALKYATESRGVSVELATSGGETRYYGSWQNTQQQLRSGRADQVNLIDDLTVYTAGTESRFDSTTLGAEYTRTDSDTENYQSIRGSLRRRGQIANGTYMIYLLDVFSKTAPNSTTTGSASQDRSENLLNVGGTFTKNVFESVALLAHSDYAYLSGDASRHDLSGSIDLKWRSGKVSVSLQTQLALRTSQGITRQEERIRLDVTRTF